MLSLPGHTIGLIIVDHGSKKAAANDMLLDVAALFKKLSGSPIVEPAHMELAEPTIEQAFDRCVAQGATMVIVHPYFLSPGRHSTTDIPNMTAAIAARHPGVRFHVTQPLGLDDKIVQLMMQRINHCIGSACECGECKGTASCDQSAALMAGGKSHHTAA